MTARVVYVVLYPGQNNGYKWESRKFVVSDSGPRQFSAQTWEDLRELRQFYETLGKTWQDRKLFDPLQILGAYV